MKSKDIRSKFIKFYTSRGHSEIPSAPLVPENDPTTLFTSSGMQPLVPYLLGQSHPSGKRLVDSQKSFRAQDIDEVGDNRHTTFFEMLGNWSLGDYFKKEQLPWIWEFLTKELYLDAKQLYVSVFEGSKDVPRDEASANIWKNLGVSEDHIFYYDVKKNWWSRSGEPEKMPPGEPGGPDSEVFFDFGEQLGLHEKSPWKHETCHPNCDCGRFMEIANSVFMQYKKESDGSLQELSQKNVDFGGGLERMTAATENTQDIFKTDLFWPIISIIEQSSEKKYGENIEITGTMRIIADHLKAAIFLMSDGVIPSNKYQGYVLRRLLRKTTVKFKYLNSDIDLDTTIKKIIEAIFEIYKFVYFENVNKESIQATILQEVANFEHTLNKGREQINRFITGALEELEELKKAIGFIQENRHPGNISLLMTKSGVIGTYLVKEQVDFINTLTQIVSKHGVKSYYVNEELSNIKEFKLDPGDKSKLNEILDYFNTHKILLNSEWTFKFVTTFGIPLEVLEDIVLHKGLGLDSSMLDDLNKKHQELSRTAAAGMFKGGLADHSEQTTKLHTAHHLMLAALQKLVDPTIKQRGSNITSERLRMDFNFSRKLTPEELQKLEVFINEKIKENLNVTRLEMDRDEAEKIGAQMEFGHKYPERVSIYIVGPKDNFFSAEFCGGPHVGFTGTLGHFTITKEESAGAGIRRLYAQLS